MTAITPLDFPKPVTAQLFQLKVQAVVQLIDEAIHGTGDKEESEVALQNLCISLLNQNQQLWQAFSQVSEALQTPKGDDWAKEVVMRMQTLLEERRFLREVTLALTNGTPLSTLQKAELESYLHWPQF